MKIRTAQRTAADDEDGDDEDGGSKGVKTGDNNRLGLWEGMLAAALAGFLGTFVYRKKSKKDNE